MRQVESFADLDSLVLRCRDARSKELLVEAVACYRAGAFRACIVTTWVAVVFDFVHKLRELDLRGDKQARALLEHFEKLRQTSDVVGALRFENDVLAQCAAFEFISPVEQTDLCRLYDDRNRCAHPAMRAEDERFDPTPELCRVHLRGAVEILLGRPATQGKAALSAVQDEVTSLLFPKDWPKAKTVLERGPLGRAKAALVRNFIVSTHKRLLADGVDRDEAERLAAALRATAAMHVSEFRSVTEEPGFPAPCVSACASGGGRRVLRLLALVPDVRHVVLDPVRTQLEVLLERVVDPELAEAIHDGLDVPELANRAQMRVSSLNKERLAALVALNARDVYAPRALELYLASPNFVTANFVAENLMLPLAEYFGAEDAVKIAAKAAEPNSQVGGGMRFRAVKARLAELGVWPLEASVQVGDDV